MIDASRPVHRIVINAGPDGKGRPLLRTQDQLLRSAAIIKAIFGGWRSGKTRGCALAFLANCFANPWRQEYGGDHPFSIIIGITSNVLRDSAYREIKALLPSDLILRETKGQQWELLLANGHLIKFRTVKGALEGASACGVWLDEAHKIPSEEIFLNYQMRASDALGRRFLVLVSGLPESGWLQETFDRGDASAEDRQRLVLFARTADNVYNPPHVIPQFRRSVSKKTAIKYLEGRWMPKESAVYFEYDTRVHLTDDAGDRRRFVHLGIDIGNKACVLFLQERVVHLKQANGRPMVDGSNRPMTALALHVVDEILPEQMSTKQAMREAQARGWVIDPRQSCIFVDPTTRADEFDSIRSVFGDEIRIVRKFRGKLEEKVEYGVDCVNAALMDCDNNVRLTFYRGLPRDARSILTVITKYHRGGNGKPVRDDIVDHACDALRYPVADLIPLNDLPKAA